MQPRKGKTMHNHIKPINKAFNVAVLHMCSRVLPKGFDVSDDAPDTLAKLTAHYKATGRVLVWSGESDNTIYGDKDVNFAFRAWHDAIHIEHQFEFTLSGEAAVCNIQIQQLIKVYGASDAVIEFCELIRAEVVGQAELYARTGAYASDQRAFTIDYIKGL